MNMNFYEEVESKNLNIFLYPIKRIGTLGKVGVTALGLEI